MKNPVSAEVDHSRSSFRVVEGEHTVWRRIKQLAAIILVFLAIQAMNQGLIRVGSALETGIPASANPRFVVGVMQQLIQAHIYFTLAPFQLTHLDPLQLAIAFGCGVFYAAAYLKTKSLLAPFLAHNFSNTTSTICGYLISGWFQGG